MMNQKFTFLEPEELEFEPVDVSVLSEIQEWGLAYCGITTDAWAKSKGEGIITALIDTGVSSHPDLSANMLVRPNIPSAWDFTGHGTHVAGIICAEQNGVGVVGVAPLSKVLPIKIVDEYGESTWYHAYKAIELAINESVDIISMSFNSPVEPPQLVHDIIKRAYDAGIILIGSTGNYDDVKYPAAYDEVIAVGAIKETGLQTSWSARGNATDVIAPGNRIYSTYKNNGYAYKSGTSMAAPFIAGIAAILLSYSRANDNVLNIYNGADMLRELDNLCDPVDQSGIIGRTTDIGFGIPQFSNYMPWKTS